MGECRSVGPVEGGAELGAVSVAGRADEPVRVDEVRLAGGEPAVLVGP